MTTQEELPSRRDLWQQFEPNEIRGILMKRDGLTWQQVKLLSKDCLIRLVEHRLEES